MKYAFVFPLLTTLFAAAPLHAAPKAKKAEPLEPPASAAANDKNATPIFDYQSDDLALVLRTLARQAGVNVILSERVKGTTTARLENKTPVEALKIIALASDLLVDELAGVYYIKNRDEIMTPEMAAYESQLAHAARPEIASKVARAKKALFDALLHEGFTRDEALQIVLANREPGLAGPKK